MKPKLTNQVGIILPTKNRPILLERALNTIFKQTLGDWCLIIVNDGGQREKINGLVEHLKRKYKCENEIFILTNENGIGKAASCNKAVELLNSEMVIVLNDDDSWAYEFLLTAATQLNYRNTIDKNVQGIISLANIMHEEIIDDHVNIKWCDVPSEKETAPFNNYVHLQFLARNNYFSSSQFLFYRSALKTMDFVKNEFLLFEDWEFHLRFLCLHSISIITQPFVNIHKRFYSTHAPYINHLKVHEQKMDYYNERITDSLLRSGSTLEGEDKNLRLLQIQTLLFLRLQTTKTDAIQVNSNGNHVLTSRTDEVLHKMSNIEHELQRSGQWFKYLEYKMTPGYIRKGKKIAKLIKLGSKSTRKGEHLKEIIKLTYKNGLHAALKNLKLKLNDK